MKINTLEPIVPDKSLGGLCLRTHMSEIPELFAGLGITTEGSYGMASPFEARYYLGDGSVQAAVDVRNGRIFKLIASKSYKGKFGAIGIGMLVRDAIVADSRLYYNEAEECIVCRGVGGITLNVAAIDPNPSLVPELPISDITVYAVEIETLGGQDGHWWSPKPAR